MLQQLLANSPPSPGAPHCGMPSDRLCCRWGLGATPRQHGHLADHIGGGLDIQASYGCGVWLPAGARLAHGATGPPLQDPGAEPIAARARPRKMFCPCTGRPAIVPSPGEPCVRWVEAQMTTTLVALRIRNPPQQGCMYRPLQASSRHTTTRPAGSRSTHAAGIAHSQHLSQVAFQSILAIASPRGGESKSSASSSIPATEGAPVCYAQIPCTSWKSSALTSVPATQCNPAPDPKPHGHCCSLASPLAIARF